ncbi:AAC(3) family N-acetyltransferase [Candidatus Pelagibacter sp.]|nr:AAC(3) family N-acetyltransferase [Candidatus Pelagibacter sp.]
MLTENQIERNLKKLNIKENFIIIHSDITGLYFKNFSLNKLWKIIFKTLGKDKTYIFPAFTLYSTKKKFWSYNKSKSDSGILSEYFRKKISSVRTAHPLHSVCIFGKSKDEIPKNKSLSSFGKGSVWEWLCRSKDVCNLSFGLNLLGGATFCHYSEEFMNVNYRKYITINFLIQNKLNKKIKKKYLYFARKKRYKNNWNKCEKELIKKLFIKKIIFPENKYQILKMNTFEVTNFLIKKLRKNKHYLIK